MDAEIEARMGVDNLSKITETAKADPTVNDNLLKDKPKLHNEDEATGVAAGHTIATQVAAAPAGSTFNPSAVPAAVQTHHEEAIIHPSTENVIGNAPVPPAAPAEPAESRAFSQAPQIEAPTVPTPATEAPANATTPTESIGEPQPTAPAQPSPAPTPTMPAATEEG